MLSTEAIDEFKQIYFDQTGINLGDQETIEVANNIYGLFKAIVKPVGKNSNTCTLTPEINPKNLNNGKEQE